MTFQIHAPRQGQPQRMATKPASVVVEFPGRHTLKTSKSPARQERGSQAQRGRAWESRVPAVGLGISSFLVDRCRRLALLDAFERLGIRAALFLMSSAMFRFRCACSGPSLWVMT